MFSIQEQCSQFKKNVLNSRKMFFDTSLCVRLKEGFPCGHTPPPVRILCGPMTPVSSMPRATSPKGTAWARAIRIPCAVSPPPVIVIADPHHSRDPCHTLHVASSPVRAACTCRWVSVVRPASSSASASRSTHILPRCGNWNGYLIRRLLRGLGAKVCNAFLHTPP